MDKKWQFLAHCGGTGSLVTNINAKDNILEIEQSKEYIIKFSSQKAVVDINEISEIVTVKKFSPMPVLLVISGTLLILTGDFLYGAFALIVGLLLLKTKYLCITHKKGLVKIQDCGISAEERESLLDYIRQYNPDCVKVIIDN